MVPLHTLISFKDDAADLRRHKLVIRAGPFNVLVLDLTKKDGQEHLTLLAGVKTFPREIFVDDMEQILVSKASPVTACNPSDRMALGWKLDEIQYVPLKEWLADYCMTTIKAGQLIKVCSRLKVPGHSKLDHRHRVELYLRFLGRPDEFIEQVLAAIPVKEKKEKKEESLTQTVSHFISILSSFDCTNQDQRTYKTYGCLTGPLPNA